MLNASGLSASVFKRSTTNELERLCAARRRLRTINNDELPYEDNNRDELCARSPHRLDDDDLTGAEAWSILATFLNADELLDEIALAARESDHGKAAYEILREVSGDTIPTLAGPSFPDRRPQLEGLTMRLTVDRQAFAAALGQAAKYVETRTTIPVLSTVLLRTGDGEIEVAATDLNRLFRATIEARVETEGAIAANANLLAGFVRGAVGRDVEMALAGSLLEVRSGHARGRIPTLAADDFPEPFVYGAANIGFEIDGAVLADCLDAVGYAISKERGALLPDRHQLVDP